MNVHRRVRDDRTDTLRCQQDGLLARHAAEGEPAGIVEADRLRFPQHDRPLLHPARFDAQIAWQSDRIDRVGDSAEQHGQCARSLRSSAQRLYGIGTHGQREFSNHRPPRLDYYFAPQVSRRHIASERGIRGADDVSPGKQRKQLEPARGVGHQRVASCLEYDERTGQWTPRTFLLHVSRIRLERRLEVQLTRPRCAQHVATGLAHLRHARGRFRNGGAAEVSRAHPPLAALQHGKTELPFVDEDNAVRHRMKMDGAGRAARLPRLVTADVAKFE